MIGLDDLTLRQLACAVAEWTGFQPEAILPRALERAAASLARTPGETAHLISRAAARDPVLVRALCEAISVGETYFLRHPEHFRYLESNLLPRWQGGVLKVWCAGCATGEEAYSLAACLGAYQESVPAFRFEVLGTDLLERNIEVARAGIFRLWSLRLATTGPLPYRLFEAMDERLVIRRELRERVRFAAHNLLEPPPGGPFDLILCRNVLVYFAPEAARRVRGQLRGALAESGEILLAPMDLSEPFEGLELVGVGELQGWRHPRATAAAPSTWPATSAVPRPQPHPRCPRLPPPPPEPAEVAAPSFEPVALHLRALAELERGRRRAAEELLRTVHDRDPSYLPAALELALLWARQGCHRAAEALMRDLQRRAEALPTEARVAGPEPLSASFYVEAARAFLQGKHNP